MTMKLRASILRERLDRALPIHCFKSNIPALMVPHLLGGAGLDCLWFDREHGATDSLSMFGLIQMAHRTDTDVVVRVSNGQFNDAAIMLDAGADAIMYPQARDVEEVEELVRTLRFPPVGLRGLDIVCAANAYGRCFREGFIEHANRQTMVILQIETPEALDSVERMAAVGGLDVLFIGLGDLSLLLDIPLDPEHPRLKEAVQRVVAAARANNLAWGTFGQDTAHVRQLLKLGAQFIAVGSDTRALVSTVQSTITEMAKIGIGFGRIPQAD